MIDISELFFFFNDTATTEIYTLSLHDALPICSGRSSPGGGCSIGETSSALGGAGGDTISSSSGRAASDRKSTRLNSSHANISYAAFCLKKKNTTDLIPPSPFYLIVPPSHSTLR